MKPGINEHGYLIVGLCKNGRENSFRVNRLVAEAFIPNPENKPEVNHLNGKTDNRASQLEWASKSENIQHAYKNNLKTTTKTMRENCRQLGKNNAKEILQYDAEGNFIKQWNSAREVERQLNIANPNICACCRGKLKTAGGFKWRYA